jgi:hypothetical protein
MNMRHITVKFITTLTHALMESALSLNIERRVLVAKNFAWNAKKNQSTII